MITKLIEFLGGLLGEEETWFFENTLPAGTMLLAL